MKYYRAGFTLAEVLITLSIIGIVAVLTTVKLGGFYGNKVIGARLLRAYQLTGNALSDVINSARQTGGQQIYALNSIQIRDINPASNSNNFIVDSNIDLFGQLASVSGFRADENYDIDEIRNYDDSALGEGYLDNCAAYRTRQAAIVIYQRPLAASIPNDNTDRIITRIYIDANAEDAPNRVGRDIFLFGMTNQGTLVPAGSQRYHDFDGNVNLYTNTCTGDTPTDGLSCAARVMADNWNINYR